MSNHVDDPTANRERSRKSAARRERETPTKVEAVARYTTCTAIFSVYVWPDGWINPIGVACGGAPDLQILTAD